MLNESTKHTVPWTGLDVLLFLGLFVAMHLACGIAGGLVMLLTQHIPAAPQVQVQVEESEEILVYVKEEKHHGHPILQLVQYGKNSPSILLLAFFAVVVAAPLAEEILFRLFFQGWLHAKLSHWNVPGASGIAIILVSLVFAAIHAGSSEKIALNIYVYVVMFTGIIIGSLFIFALGIYYLSEMRDVKAAHALFGTKRLPQGQFVVIAGVCLLALLFVFGLSFILHLIVPERNTDPIPIFFFSLALGYLYSKTGNLSYCILLHAALNITSLTLAWFTV